MNEPSHPQKNTPSHLRSVAESLNVFQDVEAREQAFEQLSRDLTNNTFILLRSAGIYDLENQALEQPYDLLLKSVSGLYDLLRTSISMRMSDGNFFVNRRQVKVDFSTFQNTRYLIKIFEFLDINELTFSPEITRTDLKLLLSTFVRIVREKRGNFRDTEIPNIQARKLKVGETHPLLLATGGTRQVASWFATAAFVVQHYYHDAAEGRVPEYALLKRSLLSLIELPSSATPLLGCLHLLSNQPADHGVISLHSVEAAGLTQVIAEALQLTPRERLSLATAAVQLFQGWTLIDQGAVDYTSKESTTRIFEELERSPELLRESRNQIVRTLLNLGGINESVLERVMITFEAQRGLTSMWDAEGQAGAISQQARPSRLRQTDKLYANGLSRSFLTDIVYGAHLFTHLRRQHGGPEAMRRLRQASLVSEVKTALFQAFGALPPSTPVEMTDGRYAIVTRCYGEQVNEVVFIEHGDHPQRAKADSPTPLRPTSPIKVKRALSVSEGDTMLSHQVVRALIFSHYQTEG